MKTDLTDSDKVFWKSIPLSLIRDERLNYASRAVAIHLLSMGKNWDFKATELHKILRYRSKNSDHLGRDQTKKIIKELELTGYLIRTKRCIKSGEWQWVTTFHPLCGIPHLNEKFSKRTSSKRPPIDGLAVDGKSVDKRSSKEESLKKKTPQPESDCDKEINSNGGVKNQQSNAPNQDQLDSVELDLSHPQLRHHHSIFTKVSMKFSQSILPAVHQQIADEFAGVLTQIQVGNHGEIHSKRAWLLALFKSAELGEFMPEFGLGIAKNREAQKLSHQRDSTLNQYLDNQIWTPEIRAKQKERLDELKNLVKLNNDNRA